MLDIAGLNSGIFQLTLVEQMKVTEREIKQRKELFEMTREDETVLFDLRGLIQGSLDALIDHFYAHQTGVPEIARLIGDAGTMGRLHASMKSYVMGLFSGTYDLEYVEARLRIGMVHKRIGVSPRLYLSGAHILEQLLGEVIMNGGNNLEGDLIRTRKRAMNKLFQFDKSYVIDTYIHSLLVEIEQKSTALESHSNNLEREIEERTFELKAAARMDQMTGLYNQRAFVDHLNRSVAMGQRHNNPVTLIYIDMDKFKDINDTQGHAEGDRVLMAFGEAILGSIRDSDIGCRYGGDEFCVVLYDSDADNAKEVLRRIRESIEVRYPDVRFSAGIVQNGPTNFVGSASMVEAGDKLMYEAKAKAKGAGGTELLQLSPDSSKAEPHDLTAADPGTSADYAKEAMSEHQA
jgi:diguanylate cyclase (GGDEF)-like protein